MRFHVDLPLSFPPGDESGQAVAARTLRLARAIEAAGIDAIAVTDHPAPSRKWRESGGHDTLDPFAALAFLAAGTSTVRLMTHLTVVGYRNPFLLAKGMTSVDVLSGGRATFVVGTGYLRSEFAALGADFENRNDIFDEAMHVVRGVMSSPHEFRYVGRHFSGYGVTLSPAPVQRPHPPIWLGGNAPIVRRRVAEWAGGWAPLTQGGTLLSKTSRTTAILSDSTLGEHIRRIREDMLLKGRDPADLEVATTGVGDFSHEMSAEQHLDRIGRLSEIGVTWTPVPFDGSSPEAAADSFARFGQDVIAPLRRRYTDTNHVRRTPR